MHANKHNLRSAFTLLELLIVLAIILIAASISVPVIQVMLDDARLQGATDMVRAKAAEARAYAMDTGKPWRVAYIPGTGVIQVAPDDSTEWAQTDTTVMMKPELFREQLPQGIYLGTSPSDVIGASATSSPGGSWQTIAIYSYDGSARDDSMTYYGKYGTSPMAMELRALTGSVAMRTTAEVMAMKP